MFLKLAQVRKLQNEHTHTHKNPHLLNVPVSLVLYGVSADERVRVPAVTFALLTVYSGQILLFVPVSNATSFLYRRRDAVR